MQHRLCVTTGLLLAEEHQITGGLKGDAGIKIGSHGTIQGVCGVLRVDDGRHAFQRGAHLFCTAHAVTQPVGDVLA